MQPRTSSTPPEDDWAGDEPSPRANRGLAILDAATQLFAARGFDATSIRDVAAAAGLQPASIYHHFPSKEALLLAVVTPAAQELAVAVTAASATGDPWQRLERACAAHLNALLSDKGAVGVLATEIPSRREGDLRTALLELRREYELIFRQLIEALPLSPEADRRYLRLTLLGAINWTLLWYRDGDDTPSVIAANIVSLLRHGAPGPD